VTAGRGANKPNSHLSAVVEVLMASADDLASSMVHLIRDEVPFHQTSDLLTDEELLRTIRSHLESVLGQIVLQNRDFNTTTATETGRRRALTGVPLPAVMSSYRVCARQIWDEIRREAAESGLASDGDLVEAASAMWQAQDQFTQAMVAGYQQQITEQFLRHEEERSALLEALFQGRITDSAAVWQAADTMRISVRGPHVVACAELTTIGRAVLPDIEKRLTAVGVSSAWRLQPDIQIGILQVPSRTRFAAAVEVLKSYPTTRVGLSPMFDDLGDASSGLRYARTAMNASRTDRSFVTVFDEDALGVTSVGAPDLMRRVSINVFGALSDLPHDERNVLLDTLEAWFDSNGSVAEAASLLYCHRNTVRQRLHRIEQCTGRSVNKPREAAELCIALESTRRLPRKAHRTTTASVGTE
jgi:hypothetical protein